MDHQKQLLTNVCSELIRPLEVDSLEHMFEREESGFDPESDGFHASIFPSPCERSSDQPASKRSLNTAVLDAFAAVEQAEVALADALTAWDQADAWSTDGALNPSAWLRSKLGISNPHAHSLLAFARKTETMAHDSAVKPTAGYRMIGPRFRSKRTKDLAMTVANLRSSVK